MPEACKVEVGQAASCRKSACCIITFHAVANRQASTKQANATCSRGTDKNDAVARDALAFPFAVYACDSQMSQSMRDGCSCRCGCPPDHAADSEHCHTHVQRLNGTRYLVPAGL